MTMEKKVNIMVVDDEEIVRASLTGWLEEDGYNVEAVESGRKALERLPGRNWIPSIPGIFRSTSIRSQFLPGRTGSS